MEPKYRLIIFDFDGTLGDTRRNIVKTLQQTMQAMQLPVADEARCVATIGLTLKDSFLRLCPGLTADEAEQCTEVYRRLFEENKRTLIPQAFPNVVRTLAELSRRGVTMAVASSRSSVSLVDLLSQMGLAPYVGCIVGAEDTPRPKPAPDPVLKILGQTGIPAAATLVVGDMPVDIQMGAAAGAATCGVTYGNASRQELEQAGADCLIDDMAELIAHVIL